MKFIALLFFLSLSSYGIEPMDNYYADDLLDAVDQAKASPHHYDYSNYYRYKRTTAQSIELNRLGLDELDKTRLESTQTNPLNDKSELLSDSSDVTSSQTSLSRNQSNISANPNHTSIGKNTQYSSQQGQIYSSGVIDNSQIISTSRP